MTRDSDDPVPRLPRPHPAARRDLLRSRCSSSDRLSGILRALERIRGREQAAQSVEEARPRAEAKGVAISFLGSSDVMIEVDKGRIIQLLDTLISNAIKFTPKGGRIDVRIVQKLDGAVLEVSDTQPGSNATGAELIA